MAVKRKRKRARKKTSAAAAPKKRRRAKRRAASSAPKKRARRTKRRRVASAAPRRRRRSAKRRSAKRRASVSNPRRRSVRRVGTKKSRRRGKRRSRRNPGIPQWAVLGLGALGGLLAFALPGAASFAITQRTDPSMATLERNRYIAGGLATLAGLAVGMLASPIVGAGIAAGGLIGLGGTDLYLAIGKVIDKPAAPAPKIAALYQGGNQRLINGVYAGGQQQFGSNGQLGINGVYSAGDMAFAR